MHFKVNVMMYVEPPGLKEYPSAVLELLFKWYVCFQQFSNNTVSLSDSLDLVMLKDKSTSG